MGEYNIKNNKGQSLIEIILAILIGALLIITSSTVIVLIVRNNLLAKNNQTAGFLAQELIDNIQVISESDWNDIYNLPSKGPSSQYYVSSTNRAIIAGTEILTIKGRDFTRYFSIKNVNRDTCGTGDISSAETSTCTISGVEVLEDHSTQKITSFVDWVGNHSINVVQYLTRHRDSVFAQTNWSGGAVLDEIITFTNNRFFTSTDIDFATTTGSIVLSAGQTSGNLTSSIFDTKRTGGAAFNAILWQGDIGDGTVKFRIASSATSTGPWNYYGWDGSGSTDYPISGSASGDTPISIMPEHHNNDRYVRYRVFLTKTSNSPQIDDIIINWSP
ncbi:MAG: hypothetical protein V3T98_02690 [Candidatus Paceibacterota bacterium]